jgi:outer membrane receptor protein involved in Fe transport
MTSISTLGLRCVAALFLAFSITAFAQNQQRKSDPSQMQPAGKISGTVIDGQTNQPIEYGNVVLYKSKDSSIVTGSVTNDKGKFSLEKLMPGRYYMKISYIGYKIRRVDSLFISPRKMEYNFGKIKLSPKNVNMNEVVVKSEKEQENYSLDKKVVNIDKNLANSGGTALDVMQNIPSVTVTADGNVSVRGNSNVTFLIDGKPSALAGLGGSDVLSQIPASAIESIELVTNPSAKYDPEGTGGIINIILKKNTDLGINGSFMGNAGSGDKYSTSARINIRKSDVNFFASYDGRFNDFNSMGTVSRQSEIATGSSLLNQVSDNKNDMKMHNFNVGGDYDFSDKDVLTLNFQYRKGDFGGSNAIDNKTFLSEQLSDYYTRAANNDRIFNNYNYTLSYKRKFEDKNQELTADAMYQNSTMDMNQNITQQYFNTDLTPFPGNPLLQQSINDGSNKMLLFQSNYAQPLKDIGKIEVGFRSTIKDILSNNDLLNYNYNTGSWATDLLSANHFEYKEQIHAIYGTYSNNIDAFRFQLGLRAEEALIHGDVSSQNLSFNDNYFAVYPTVHLGYNFSELDEVSMSYSRRVDRPGPRQLNPFIDYSDSLNIVQGNPKLSPQYINSYEIGYNKSIDKTSLVTSFFYKQNNNMISTVSQILPNGATFSTYDNVAKGISYGVEFIVNSPVVEWWRINTNVSFFKSKVDDNGSLGVSQESNSWTAKLNSNMTLMEGLQLQIMANYNSPTVLISMGNGGGFGYWGLGAQTKLESQYFMDMILRKDFMDGKLSFNLRVTDLFNTRKFNSQTTGLGFISQNNQKFDSRVVYFGVSYRLDSKRNFEDEQRQKKMNEEGFDELPN